MNHEHEGVPPFMAALHHHGDFGPPFGFGTALWPLRQRPRRTRRASITR